MADKRGDRMGPDTDGATGTASATQDNEAYRTNPPLAVRLRTNSEPSLVLMNTLSIGHSNIGNDGRPSKRCGALKVGFIPKPHTGWLSPQNEILCTFGILRCLTKRIDLEKLTWSDSRWRVRGRWLMSVEAISPPDPNHSEHIRSWHEDQIDVVASVGGGVEELEVDPEAAIDRTTLGERFFVGWGGIIQERWRLRKRIKVIRLQRHAQSANPVSSQIVARGLAVEGHGADVQARHRTRSTTPTKSKTVRRSCERRRKIQRSREADPRVVRDGGGRGRRLGGRRENLREMRIVNAHRGSPLPRTYRDERFPYTSSDPADDQAATPYSSLEAAREKGGAGVEFERVA
ncbi:hypothetical protein BJ322DRAFT_1023596 [Thelephora terrestris]|uniref:Uncharacterized protein n=1 Tax=Thelephora terrestris TaxID=56493 RepID=A0A9P6H8R4_9AGAM|nr:hypothetical protein BJ322DRAFT_1023596 [Thelephora terrestris]